MGSNVGVEGSGIWLVWPLLAPVQKVEPPFTLSMERYRYIPLSSTCQIRLLRLFAGRADDELSGELFHTSLNCAPRFTALSYTWGDPKPRKAIRCCGLIAEVGSSLHNALRHLRGPDDDIILWADALLAKAILACLCKHNTPNPPDNRVGKHTTHPDPIQ